MSKKYMVFDAMGELTRRLVEGVHDIPHEAIEVAGELWDRSREETDGVWVLDKGVVRKQPFPLTALDLSKVVESARYVHEIAGITFNDMKIETTRDSQGLITGAAVQAIIDPAYKLRWKTSAGFVVLDAAQLLGVASAVRAHVQACFDREAQLLLAVAEGSFTNDMLEQGWP